MKLTLKLLDHPFYQKWTQGDITTEQLSKYAQGYLGFISQMPSYWEKITEGFGIDTPETKETIEDEKRHVALWERWADCLPKVKSYATLENTISAFSNMAPSELLGAVYAFEIQQPEVAKTKKQGLVDHYGFQEEDLVYFNEHENEAKHISLGQKLANVYADKNEFESGFEKGQALVFHSLDAYL